MRVPLTLARDKHPHGTSSQLLSAAWSPTWHGSQPKIAQDSFVNTSIKGADHTKTVLRLGFTPAYSGFQVQGTATAPDSMTLYHNLFILF